MDDFDKNTRLHDTPKVLLICDSEAEEERLSIWLNEAGYHIECQAWDHLGSRATNNTPLACAIVSQCSQQTNMSLNGLHEYLGNIPVIFEYEYPLSQNYEECFVVPKSNNPSSLILAIETVLTEGYKNSFSQFKSSKNRIFLSKVSAIEYRFQGLEECFPIAQNLAQLFPNPRLAQLGLTELMINAIEHGNLELRFHLKKQFKTPVEWKAEIERRLRLPEYKDRCASIRVYQTSMHIEVVITDQGEGFDFKKFLVENKEPRAKDDTLKNGRGIMMARTLCFDQLLYKNGGKEVRAVVYLA